MTKDEQLRNLFDKGKNPKPVEAKKPTFLKELMSKVKSNPWKTAGLAGAGVAGAGIYNMLNSDTEEDDENERLKQQYMEMMGY